jgi:hypothetical protein
MKATIPPGVKKGCRRSGALHLAHWHGDNLLPFLFLIHIQSEEFRELPKTHNEVR